MLEHLPDFTELAQHRPQLEANLEGLLQRGLALRQRRKNIQRLLEPGPGLRDGRSPSRLGSGLPEIVHCLLLQLALDGMMGEPLDLLAQAVGVEPFHRIHDARVDFAATFAEYPTVGDVVGESVLERILQLRKEP